MSAISEELAPDGEPDGRPPGHLPAAGATDISNEIQAIARRTLQEAAHRRHRAWVSYGWIGRNEQPDVPQLPKRLLQAHRTDELVAYVATALDNIGYRGRRIFEQRLVTLSTAGARQGQGESALGVPHPAARAAADQGESQAGSSTDPPGGERRTKDPTGSRKRGAPVHTQEDIQLSCKQYGITKDFLARLAREKHERLVERKLRTQRGGPTVHSVPPELLTIDRSNCLHAWAQSLISEEYGEEARAEYTNALMQSMVADKGADKPMTHAA